MKKEAVSIFKAYVARQLLKQGYQIIDIKPNNENSERSVFVFKNDDGLMEEVNRISVAQKK